MRSYSELSAEELRQECSRLQEQYDSYRQLGLHLNMSRRKPCPEQLNLSMGLMDVLSSNVDLHCADGTDCRNYGVLGGIREAQELLGSIIECPPESIMIYGNSALNVMYDQISRSMTHGVMGSTPWCKLDKVKFLCPVPGYDRHFAITEYFGIDMINVPMSDIGPDMDMVEELVSSDPSIKGIWCVPKYSNPTGITYSEETVKRFARLKPAAPDFRIYWDNAYSVHQLYDDDQDFLIEILAECQKAGNPDIVYKFTSTSKISFPGSGIAAIATSENNLKDIRRQFRIQTIGHDKVNQLRHVRYFRNVESVREHMMKHAAILRPKFELVERIFDEELSGLGIGTWTKPKGGYFIAFQSLPGLARSIISSCKECGVELTEAGATYPYHNDPEDSSIRIAPTYPSLEELEKASYIFATVVRLETVRQLLEKR